MAKFAEARHAFVTGFGAMSSDFNTLLVEAPGVEAGRDQAKARILKDLRAQLGERVLTIFRRNPRLLVHIVTHVTDSLGATGRADVRAVLVLLDDVLARIEAEDDVGQEAGESKTELPARGPARRSPAG